MPHSCLSEPKGVASLLIRASFGLSVLFVGLTHYMDFDSFSLMASDGLGVFSMLGTLWSFIYPALLIVGGALFVIGYFRIVATWAVGIALGSVPAGMLLKPILSGVALDEMMPPANTAFIWLIVFAIVVMADCCGSGGGCGCGGSCGCACCGGDLAAKAAPTAVVTKTVKAPATAAVAPGDAAKMEAIKQSAAPAKPASTMKAAPKKPIVKKKVDAPPVPPTA
jgi:hypothetical protein